MKKKILLVEDDPGLYLTLTDRLESENFEIIHTDNGDEAVKIITENKFDLILLDIMIKGKNGFDVCFDIRSRGNKTPVLFLTAKGETFDKICGFKLGGDDYITKPFDTAELLARIEALIRRNDSLGKVMDNIKFDDIEIDLNGMIVKKNNKTIELSKKEFLLLKFFVLNRDRAVTRDEILNSVWGYEESPTTRTIDTHIGWLRQKLEADPKKPKYFLTVHSTGYKFVLE